MTRVRATAVRFARWLGGRRRVLPATALVLRARTVRPTLAFIARARSHRAAAGGNAYAYTLRENGLRVVIRHGTGDEVTLGEVFHEHDYRPPAEIETRLADVERIVDLGANVGLFGAFAAGRWPHAEILAFEPDPANAALHERTIALNDLQRRWTLVRAAAGTRDGGVAFVAGEVALSRLAADGEVADAIEVPLRDVLGELAGADLVKIDIEGGEWAILGDPRFRDAPPRALVLEYHPRFCPNGDSHGAAESALAAAGLSVRSVWRRPDGHGMLWAWRS
jgi:FkbM family methyltransferase